MSDTILNPRGSTSLLQPTHFELTFNRIPDVQYWCKKVSLPGGSLNTLTQPTPFINRKVAGNKIEYNNLKISFLLEETMISWQEIHDWMKDLGIQTGYKDYNNLAKQVKQVAQVPSPATINPAYAAAYSDAILTILDSQNNPIQRFQFKDCFPVSLSDIDFDVTESAEEVYTIDASFGFFYYDLLRVPG